MPKNLTITLLLVALIAAVFYHGCRPTPTCYIIPIIDTKPIKSRLANNERKADSLSHANDSLEKVKNKVVHHWHTIKRDSLIPVEVLVNVCDSMHSADSTYANGLKKEITVKDSIISDLKQLQAAKDINHSIEIEACRDSTKAALREVRRQKWQKRGILALWTAREGVGLSQTVR